MFRIPATAHRMDDLEDLLEMERLALLNEVESKIRARSKGKKYSPYRNFEAGPRTPGVTGSLENQIAELLNPKDSGKETGNTASKIKSIRNLIEFHVHKNSRENLRYG